MPLRLAFMLAESRLARSLGASGDRRRRRTCRCGPGCQRRARCRRNVAFCLLMCLPLLLCVLPNALLDVVLGGMSTCAVAVLASWRCRHVERAECRRSRIGCQSPGRRGTTCATEATVAGMPSSTAVPAAPPAEPRIASGALATRPPIRLCTGFGHAAAATELRARRCPTCWRTRRLA